MHLLIIYHRKKSQVWIRNEKYLVILYDYGKIKIKINALNEDDHGGFQQQNPQAAVNKQYHMNSWDKQWMIRLKAMEAECYSIEN